MSASGRKIVYSKVSAKNQTALPRAVREHLRIGPGDRLRYVIDDKGVRLERSAPKEKEDPFATFTEWASAIDEEAYASF